jgi:phosphinothricin acetyltransferase
MTDLAIRAATEDAAAICLIYNQGIEDRIATLEIELRTPRAAAVAGGAEPASSVFVAVVEETIVGWSSLNVQSATAYQHVADLSVYVDALAGKARAAGSSRTSSSGRHRLPQDDASTFPSTPQG